MHLLRLLAPLIALAASAACRTPQCDAAQAICQLLQRCYEPSMDCGRCGDWRKDVFEDCDPVQSEAAARRWREMTCDEHDNGLDGPIIDQFYATCNFDTGNVR